MRPAPGYPGHMTGPSVVLLVFAAVAAVDIVVIVRRKARGEPG
ncbi:hypothetical protein SAMN05660485_03107 [Blastococcus fimeti]|nr:hypothetical protein SAMN05660485_03107 [Blastococcus fimeti]